MTVDSCIASLRKLHFYATLLSLVQLCVHLLFDGICSAALWTAWAILIVAHHRCRFYRRYDLQISEDKPENLPSEFATSCLCFLRLPLLALRPASTLNSISIVISTIVLLSTFIQEFGQLLCKRKARSAPRVLRAVQRIAMAG
ncbi:unnamed protein product, partial [Mesorhabditis spiculigera]